MRWFCVILALVGSSGFSGEHSWPELLAWKGIPLPGTERLETGGDLSLRLIEMNDRFLDRRIREAIEKRGEYWKGDGAVEKNRGRLVEMLGLHRDSRWPSTRLEFEHFGEITGSSIDVFQVKWRAFEDVHGSGWLFQDGEAAAGVDLVFLPDADEGFADVAGVASRLASSGCRVLVMDLVSRDHHPRFRMTLREWLHRPAFILGRTLIGYELHKVFAALDALQVDGDRPIGVYGRGEGGLLALYAAAIDRRIKGVAVAGYFGPRESRWIEPADRNVFGIQTIFGDAEMARLIAPRQLFVTPEPTPDFSYRPGPDNGLEIKKERPALPGKPGRIPRFSFEEIRREWERIPDLRGGCHETEEACLHALCRSFGMNLKEDSGVPGRGLPFWMGQGDDSIREIEKHTQWILHHSSSERKSYWKELDSSSLDSFGKTVEPYREQFRRDVIGDFDLVLSAPRARSRPYQRTKGAKNYEVVLDVADGLIAYGILTVPVDLDLSGDERRPVVVCQHGLEGTPQDLIGEVKFKAYKAFATRLAEEGFVTFAPQNGYRYFDLFRLQQFKAQAIGKTLFSIMIPQHQQITEWLSSLPFVDGERIAFYGLSYGGKSAMRIPPLVDRYCLSICSADFNEWVWKNAATDAESLRYSYVNKGEYEIFEWDLGGTFNYAEMATLIAPRPFMVERGHFDGVAPDERVAQEFARVRHLYQARLGLGDRCEIEWFAGPHSINGVGTFDFLRKHLDWPKPR